VNVIIGGVLFWQTDVVPLITAVGKGLTIIVADPVSSPGCAAQSQNPDSDDIVYVVVEVGLTSI
jgi:uncharacterized protein YlxW (UPF0749 family)